MEETNAKAVIDLVERLDATEELAIGGVGEPATDLLVVAEKKKVIDLLPFHMARRETPLRREGTSTHTTLESFIDHVARHRDSQSAIFADDVKSPPTLTAIYDYNDVRVLAAALRRAHADRDRGRSGEDASQARPGTMLSALGPLAPDR